MKVTLDGIQGSGAGGLLALSLPLGMPALFDMMTVSLRSFQPRLIEVSVVTNTSAAPVMVL